MKPIKPKKRTPAPASEGWIPSPELMWQLISIAPLSWYEQLASVAVREGLIKTPTDWSRDPGEFVPGIDLAENAQHLIEDRGIEGHEHGVDLPLLWEQLIAADHAEINRDYRIELPIIDSEEARWLFLENKLPVQIAMPALGVTLDVTAHELVQALIATSSGGYHVRALDGVGWNRINLGDDLETRMWALDVLTVVEAFALHHAPPDMSQHFSYPLEEAARFILRKHGYLRGPCERCGRRWWLVSEPKPKGRPPLVYTNCPPCVEIIKRTQGAARAAKSRQKNKAHQ